MDGQSNKVKAKRLRRKRAHLRVRARVQGTPERPRLAVFKSLRFTYAQVIDDTQGHTLVQANSQEAAVRASAAGSAGSKGVAEAVGKVLAERAKAQGISQVVFDRGGFAYHGRIKAVADGARSQGLVF